MADQKREYDSSHNLRAIDGGREGLFELMRDIRDHLSSGGGSGTYAGMERIAKLEARADITDQRLGRIEDKLDRVLERLGSMPTTAGLWGMVAAVIGTALAIIASVLATAGGVSGPQAG